ncbi:MAG: endopeptidase La [candidate division Zixibacteria bacterium]|nr:endopeptidase La [candidate division Zixibacteria bacterium]
MVVFPYVVVPLMISSQKNARLVDDALMAGRTIGLVAQKSGESDSPGPDDIYRIGTTATILKMLRFPDGSVRFLVQGLSRFRITEFTELSPNLTAKVEYLDEHTGDSIKIEALNRNILEILRKVVDLAPNLAEEVYVSALNQESPSKLADYAATNINISQEERQELLETLDVRKRLEKVHAYLNKELEVLELSKKIQSDAASEMGKSQKEYILREQLKAIHRELGEADDRTAEVEEFKQKIGEAKMHPVAQEAALKELDRLSRMNPSAAEYTVSRTYIEWLISLPWAISIEDDLDIKRAAKILNEDHYDLEKVKERILEYLAVRMLKPDVKGPILCFAGPPGVGKTSLGQSIARAMGRKFQRIALGGMHDEAEIRGHRRTYIGSMPGRIIQSIRRAGSNNPVFMLDEIDKVGKDFRGDPASALLEVLDPEQNDTFSDHYLDCPFDLSKVMFITTANVLDTIPDVLRDRMEVIRIPGYTDLEKIQIAKKYLVPRELENHGLKHTNIDFRDAAIKKMINEYTRESGLRNLNREIATACRKVARGVAEGKHKKVSVVTGNVNQFLGPPKFVREKAERVGQVGAAAGLAWTSAGGEVLYVEATKMAGKGSLTLTGHLGEVMKESVQAALSFIRSQSGLLCLNEHSFENTDIHVHVPAGAVPKDGPSAGITMATAIASLMCNRPVKPRIAMTGEITLRGNVLPIGGLKEKLLGAYAAGMTTVILPQKNRKDTQEIPEELMKNLKLEFVDNIQQVFELALEKKATSGTSKKRATRAVGKKKKTRK